MKIWGLSDVEETISETTYLSPGELIIRDSLLERGRENIILIIRVQSSAKTQTISFVLTLSHLIYLLVADK